MNNNLFDGSLKDAIAEVRGEAKPLDEASNPQVKQIRKLLGPGKTTSERGSHYFSHELTVKEAKSRLDSAGISHTHHKTQKGNEVSVSYMQQESIEHLDEALPDWAKDVFDAEKTPTKKKASAKAQDKDDIDVSAFNPKTDGKYKIQKFAKGRVNRGNYGNKVNAAEVDTPDAHDEDKAIDHNSGIKAGVDHPWIPKPKTPVTKAAKTVSQGVTGKQKQQDQAKLAQHHQALLDRINRTPKKGRAALMGRLPKEYHHMVEAFGERDAHRELSIGAGMSSGGGAPIKNKGITTTNHSGAVTSHGSLGEANRHIMSSIKPGESHTLHDNGVKVATMTHRAGQIHTEFH